MTAAYSSGRGQNREGVGHPAVLPSNVPDVWGEFGDKGELLTHPGDEVVVCLTYSVRQGLVVHETYGPPGSGGGVALSHIQL